MVRIKFEYLNSSKIKVLFYFLQIFYLFIKKQLIFYSRWIKKDILYSANIKMSELRKRSCAREGAMGVKEKNSNFLLTLIGVPTPSLTFQTLKHTSPLHQRCKHTHWSEKTNQKEIIIKKSVIKENKFFLKIISKKKYLNIVNNNIC